MVRYDVGVTAKETYQLKSVDDDVFEDSEWTRRLFPLHVRLCAYGRQPVVESSQTAIGCCEENFGHVSAQGRQARLVRSFDPLGHRLLGHS